MGEQEVTLTIDGAPVPVDVIDFHYTVARTAEKIARNLKPLVFEASVAFDVAGDALRSLMAALVPPTPPGASEMTLARRVAYGGRKGRSAMRRLHARGYVGILRVNDEPPVPCPPMTFTPK